MRPFSKYLVLILLVSQATAAYSANSTKKLALGDSGFLVVTAAQDTSSGYHWVDGPGTSQRSLVWPSGVINIPTDYPVEGFGPFDLAIPCAGVWGGVGNTGRLLMEDGQYRIDEPIFMTDGTVHFFADDGLLEIVASRVRYFPPEIKKKSTDPKASFILLVGLAVLIAVLIRRSRRIIKQRANPS